MIKRAGFAMLLGILLAIALCASPFSELAKANGASVTVVEGLDDPICETPYQLENPEFRPPYLPNPDYDPSDFLTSKYRVNPAYEAEISPFLPNPDSEIDCDVERIQAAVDASPDGGSTILRGTFNLGEGNPRLGKAVDMRCGIGETCASTGRAPVRAPR